MEAKKLKLLNKTFDQFIQACLLDDKFPLNKLDEMVVQGFMGYGTAGEEVIHSIDDLQKLIIKQRKEGAAIEKKLHFKPVTRIFSKKGDVAIVVDEADLELMVDGRKINMLLRISCVFEYQNGKWVGIHFHSSTPTESGDESDTWHIRAWQNKMDELEKQVAEKTADLASKNRELEIEAALERVRARTMAMQDSSELQETATILFKEFNDLSLVPRGSRLYFCLIDSDRHDVEVWMTKPDGLVRPGSHRTPMDQEKLIKKMYVAWREKEPIFIRDYQGKELKGYLEFLGTLPHVGEDEGFQKMIANPPKRFVATDAYFRQGTLGIMGFEPLSNEANDTLIRFARLFEQTYTRFLDLQKAEAQAMEAEIELALERIRSRSMAMQNSNELAEILGKLFDELKNLELELARCIIWIIDTETECARMWISSYAVQGLSESYFIPNFDHPYFNKYIASWKARKSLWKLEIKGKHKLSWDQYLFEETELRNLPKEAIEAMRAPKKIFTSNTFNKYGLICAAGTEPLSEESNRIFTRFGKVFEQAYTRFEDIRQAEAQAKEAQIEAALERIRARAMAMHSSDELVEVAHILREQMGALGYSDLECAFVDIYDEKSGYLKEWFAFRPPESSSGEIISGAARYKLDGAAIVKKLYKIYKSGAEEMSFRAEGAELAELEHAVIYDDPNLVNFEGWDQAMPAFSIHYVTRFSGGHLCMTSYQEPSEEIKSIQRRATATFDLAYRRYFDLQKAEDQAKEAQIEAALERIRARAMAMHNSDELVEVAVIMREQMGQLNHQELESCIVMLYDEENRTLEEWNAFHPPGEDSGKIITGKAIWDLDEAAIIKGLYRIYKSGQEETVYTPQKKSLLELFAKLPEKMPELFESYDDSNLAPRVHYLTRFSGGHLLTITFAQPSEELRSLQKRITSVFELAFRRYLDLAKAEAQAKEARIEVALERIRSRAMAMHSSSELEEVAKVLREQMKLLDQPELEGTVVELYEEIPDKIISWYAFRPVGSKKEELLTGTSAFSKDGCTHLREMVEMYNSPLLQYTITSSGAKLQEFLDLLVEVIPEAKEHFEGFPVNEVTMHYHHADFSGGTLVMAAQQEPSGETKELLRRASKAFDLAYRRFLDLKKAEAQAREAQIEAALERIRAASMAMHESDQLSGVALTLMNQIELLGISDVSCSINIVDPGTLNFYSYAANIVEGHDLKTADCFPELNLKDFKFLRKVLKLLKSGQTLFSVELKGQALEELLDTWKGLDLTILSNVHIKKKPGKLHLSGASFDRLSTLSLVSLQPLTHEEMDILERMAKTFGLSYRRFLDLKKAEEQAREAQIEASLERVRAKAMAMHSTQDISEAIAVVFNELTRLGVTMERCGIITGNNTPIMGVFSTRLSPKKHEVIEVVVGILDTNIHPLLQSVYQAWKNKIDHHTYELKGAEVKNYYNLLEKEPGYRFPKISKYKDYQIANTFSFNDGSIFVFTDSPLTNEFVQICLRFTKVFSHTYRRYIDLINAERQAREAQIEAALERVRGRALAMHNSEELVEVIKITFEQLIELNLTIDTCAIDIFKGNSNDFHLWPATPEQIYLQEIKVPYLDNPMFNRVVKARSKGRKFVTDIIDEDDIKHYYQHAFTKSVLGELIGEKRRNRIAEVKRMHRSMSVLKNTGLLAANFRGHNYTDEENQIIARFGQVFEQSYTRFLDLQKAEAQAREAQIEAALERIRSRAMAMHSSNELIDVAIVLREQMGLLGQLELAGCIIHIYPEKSESFDSWFAIRPPDQKEIISGAVKFRKNACALTEKWLSLYHSERNEYTVKTSGTEYKDWVKIRNEVIGYQFFKNKKTGESLYQHFTDFTGGTLITAASKEPTTEVKDLQRRTAAVFDLAYRRFIDLQKAEAREKDAIKQSAMDRIRAEIASMRTAKDLEKITPLIWKELSILEVPFFRCGVFIMDESRNVCKVFLTTPEGKSLAAMGLPFGSSNLVDESVNDWRSKKILRREWDKNEFLTWTKSLIEQGYLKDPENFQGREEPPEHLALHFVPFSQGMLYVGSQKALSDEHLELVQLLANAFSVAYARYEDFNQLEKTLGDLKSAQSQLIHAEKMASLGELTAGIAHEIKNPLNFVNNFSELNAELIEELAEEIEKGDFEEAMIIAKNIRDNEHKIAQHGKRADGIVQSMLQHSRGGRQDRVPTDINALADEYLKLAYHGMRARDKTFTAQFETEFDPDLPKIKVIPQDIGRVLLNLINNAFQACGMSQPGAYLSAKALANEGAPGKVKLKTQFMNASRQGSFLPDEATAKAGGPCIQISVSDNGPGIPDAIKDKIFQPFFTTKPTGEGTGLGLSMSYDIVTKGHGGEMKFDNNNGEGTRFIVRLPIVN